MVVRINKKQAASLGLASKRGKRKKIAVPLNGPGYRNPIIIEVQHPPSVNHHYVHGKGRVFLSKEAKSFRKAFAVAAFGKGHVSGKVEVSLRQSGRFDCDALIKETLDAAQSCGLIANDDQVVKIIIFKCEEDMPLMTVKFAGCNCHY